AEDLDPLDETLSCPASSRFSKAYLHHLVRSEELLGQVLLSWHNVAYYQGLMARMRAAIAAGGFADFAAQFRAAWPSEPAEQSER
ncbi:MAG: tRNA-guanine transglycosylase, partial [Hyphomonadaceae bacterium]|nr:tRNA-guanine transglycosylase [Hyphomonadaceae bacterium]